MAMRSNLFLVHECRNDYSLRLQRSLEVAVTETLGISALGAVFSKYYTKSA